MSVHQADVFLSLLSEGGNAGLWSYNPATQQLDADAATCNLMQCPSPPGGLGRLLACVQPADRALLEQDMEIAMADQGAFARTFQVQGMGESAQLTLRARWLVLPDAGEGELLGVVERCLLSTQQAQAVEQRFEHLRNVLKDSPVVLYEQDAQLRYEWVLAPRVGLKPESITGKMSSDFLEPASAFALDQAKQWVMDSAKSSRKRLHILPKGRPGGVFDVYMAPRFGPQGQVNGVISVAIDIAEATEHEQRVLAIFEQAPVAITLSRQSDGVFLKANRTFLELMGYTQEEVTGSSAIALELWHPPQSRDTMLAELQSKGHVRNLIAGYRKKSGQTGRLLVSVEPIQVGGEKMMLGIMTDISGLEEARQALALSEARYKLLSEASFEGVGLARDGIVVDANAQIAHILGVSREDLIGKPVTGNMKPRDEPGALLTFQREGDSSKEYEYLRPDGSSVIVEVRSKDLEHAGEMLRISAVRDVTEKKQKELALLNLQLRFALMMDSNVVGIFIAGLDGRIFEANDYFLNMLGLDRQALEAGELNWQSLTAPDTLEITVKSVHDMAQNGGNLPYEKTYLHADGHRVPALVALSRLSSEPTRGIVIVLDISDLKSTQSALLERTRAAERAEAAKTLFLSSVSHELRTPLHTMLGHVRLMRKKASGEDLQQLSVVERSSTHLLRLIEDVLEYNHSTIAPERLEPEVVVVRGFLANLQLIGNAATVDSDNQFFLQLSDGLPATLVVDEVRLTQVLRILIDNACKYTRAGVLIFSLSMEGELRLVDGTQRCGLRFSVEDNGRGIDAADVRHIFEPLRRGSNATDLHGLGLGLAIAAQWIERMGSTIGVETSRGFGSHFSFLLDLEVGFEAVPSKRELLFGIHSLLQTPQAKLSFLPLPEEDIHALGELIRMGRLGRLRDWAHALEMRHPQHRDAAVVVGELAANADLDALEKLHGRWAALSYQEE